MKPSEIRTPAGRAKAAMGIATTEPKCNAAARLPGQLQHRNTAPCLPAALAYADRLGLAVLPCAGKVPTIRGGRGVFDATTDPATIRRWWEEYPFANIGIATGARSGIVIVDVDGDAGRATLAQLEACYGPLPETPRQITGSGGLHLVFAYDPVRSIGNRVRCMAGIDTRSDGGYFIASPSRHPETGTRYRWHPEVHPLKLRPAPLPAWLGDLLVPRVELSPVGRSQPAIEEEAGWGPKPRYARAALQRACEAIEGAAIGQQAQTLNSEAYSIGRLIGAGLMPRRLAVDCLIYSGSKMTDATGRRPWRERDSQQTVVRAIRAGEQHPREPA